MKYTIKEASKACGMPEDIIWKQMRRGWLSSSKNAQGDYIIDSDDLFMVFPKHSIDNNHPLESTSCVIEDVDATAQVTEIDLVMSSDTPQSYISVDSKPEVYRSLDKSVRQEFIKPALRQAKFISNRTIIISCAAAAGIVAAIVEKFFL